MHDYRVYRDNVKRRKCAFTTRYDSIINHSKNKTTSGLVRLRATNFCPFQSNGGFIMNDNAFKSTKWWISIYAFLLIRVFYSYCYIFNQTCLCFYFNAAYSSTGKWKKNNKIIKCQEQNCKAGPRIVCCYCGRNPVCFIIKFNITCSSINKNLRAHRLKTKFMKEYSRTI